MIYKKENYSYMISKINICFTFFIKIRYTYSSHLIDLGSPFFSASVFASLMSSFTSSFFSSLFFSTTSTELDGSEFSSELDSSHSNAIPTPLLPVILRAFSL